MSCANQKFAVSMDDEPVSARIESYGGGNYVSYAARIRVGGTEIVLSDRDSDGISTLIDDLLADLIRIKEHEASREHP